MPISFGSSNGSGKPYIRYTPQANAWMKAGEGGPEEFDPKSSGMLIDVEKMTMGWLHIGEGVRDWQPWPTLNGRTKQPGPEYKVGFAATVYAPKLLGEEVHEFCQNTTAATMFIQDLYNQAEPQFGQGKVPLVTITGSKPIKIGKGTTREILFSISKWVDRPEVLDAAVEVADDEPPFAAVKATPKTSASADVEF